MPSGIGTLVLPIVIVHGADKASGSYTIPMFVVSGASLSTTGNLFECLVPVISGTGGGLSPYTLITVPVPVISSTGSSGVLGRSGLIKLPTPIISTGISYRGDGAIVLPLFQAMTIAPLHGLGAMSLPLFVYEGIISQIPVSRVYRGIVANLRNKAISTYSNLPLNSIAYFNGQYIGATDQGLFVLGGNKDNASNIVAKLNTGPLDLGEGFIKYLRDVWITYTSDGHIVFTVYVDEKSSPVSTGSTEVASDKIHEEKLKIGRGLKGRFFTIELTNASGADFDIDSISALVEAIQRKLR
jgi:hypothetical protein